MKKLSSRTPEKDSLKPQPLDAEVTPSYSFSTEEDYPTSLWLEVVAAVCSNRNLFWAHE